MYHLLHHFSTFESVIIYCKHPKPVTTPANMPLSYYDLIVPTMISRCGILCSLMDKAAAFADSKGMPHSELINARLIEDMEPFKYQI